MTYFLYNQLFFCLPWDFKPYSQIINRIQDKSIFYQWNESATDRNEIEIMSLWCRYLLHIMSISTKESTEINFILHIFRPERYRFICTQFTHLIYFKENPAIFQIKKLLFTEFQLIFQFFIQLTLGTSYKLKFHSKEIFSHKISNLNIDFFSHKEINNNVREF